MSWPKQLYFRYQYTDTRGLMAALKPAKHQPNQGLERAVKKMRELVLIHDHAKEKARYKFFRVNDRIQ